MAYSQSDRFSAPDKYFPFYDPGTYQFEKPKLQANAVPFLSKVSRKTGESSVLWTQAIYNPVTRDRIPNVTSLKSKQERFPYKAFSEEDLKEILCKCGIESSYVSPAENESATNYICQGKIKRRLFKGPAPRSSLGDEGLSAPSRNDQGFKINTYGSQKRVVKEIKDVSPPFYNTRVEEFTMYYHGCKWSAKTSERSPKYLETGPGPADYDIQKKPTADEICAEKVRAHKRKDSQQPRYIEMVQLQNIREGRPGPASYNPSLPNGTNLKFIGPKAKRFPSSKNVAYPGPSEYWVRRNFDPMDRPQILCKANLPEPAFFGIKSKRFKLQHEEGASPATYNVCYNLCRFMHCPTAPFGVSSARFKSDMVNDTDEEEMLEVEEKEQKNLPTKNFPQNMWMFKSNTIRMKPLVKNFNEPSPADILPRLNKFERSPRLQHCAPFYSSEGRFHPWHNWIPVHSKFITPTPCDYNTEKLLCLPAFNHGPMFRTERFPMNKYITPAPNEYNVSGGVETILKTHNQRLLRNIDKKHCHTWNPPVQKQMLNFEQRETLLLQKCIDLLEPTMDFEVTDNSNLNTSTLTPNERKDKKARTKDKVICKSGDTACEITEKSKMLRSFLYTNQFPCYF